MGQWLLGLLIVLAIVASVLMVFSDQLSVAGSLAVIAALWAAVIGAILVTKFRRQAESAEAKSRDLRLVYELQLEREIAARRQYELDVETTIRKELSAEANEELAELKAQVLSLRASLEALLGEPLPDTRVALPSEKMRELATGIGGEYGGGEYGGAEGFRTDDSALAARDFAATAPATDLGRHIHADVDPNAMTEIIPIVTDEEPMSGRIAAEEMAGATDEVEVEDAVLAEPEETVSAEETGPTEEAVGFEEEGGFAEEAAPVEEAPAEEWVGEEWAGAEAAATEAPVPAFGTVGRHETSGESAAAMFGGRRRRRADEDGENAHSAGLPVAELLSQLRQSGAPDAGRRRREH
ncbi:hypothetical protein GORHZ_058_00090 [Gordonia rhizosphera NBRC 16068]|uniref:DUF6779 domain-containing protein n=1 Tax=Gordonia rhizosphera NBRC 16068 TaxID=1108045 RepID=K6WAZ8_9ACTN|nr:hypothetical protein GORHZ_058_00090 [Gordonia rhizosphera NBRC 16068]